MAEQAKRPCRKFHCPGLATPPASYCAVHSTLGVERTKQADRDRGTAAERGYDHAWRVVRLSVLRRDKHTCVLCLLDGRPVNATDVHHVLPLVEYPLLRLDTRNLVSLCHECNVKEDARRRRGELCRIRPTAELLSLTR